ncbi:hypothetical protein HMPREF0872_05705 [Veillonella montpellierensis DNF00314]|uniref:Lipoyl-binding domain-containing protein n=1 Tax=Veillonella montpellierensis DNF00314 TaxID=1401067 RepID=A0A096AKL0_9FIRM|nr:hypothetical protein [Veillonella montpellierensis]KGF47171.1 hypothetical protein HMPREF0872_05705 [Veillonella montpellierensis DNF00314]
MKKNIIMAVVAVLTAIGIMPAMAQPVQQFTVLSGTVATVLPVGTAVTEGDTLLTIETLAGPMAGAKATVDGVVSAVEAQIGSSVERGQVVVTIESK